MKKENIDLKIQTFLSRKSKQFPELDEIVRKD